MASFPLFVDLKNKKCVIIGAGLVAYRKIEILLRYEARLCVVAPTVCAKVEQLHKEGLLTIEQRYYHSSDLSNAFLVIAATADSLTNTMVYEEAIRRNIPVNVVDEPQKCTFYFPSIIKRGELSIGISTHGKFPALSKRLRKRISEDISPDYEEIVERLGEFRSFVKRHVLLQSEREQILKQVLDEFYEHEKITVIALEKLLSKYENQIELAGGKENG